MIWMNRLLVVAAAGILIGCGGHKAPAPTPPPVTHPIPVEPTTRIPAAKVEIAPDPTVNVIASAEREFNAGKKELELGHLVGARDAFDRAVDVMLAIPKGARSDPRYEAAFEKLLDRISALELIALREGDGFSETKSEPAVIDELLGFAMTDPPPAAIATEEAVRADLEKTPHDLPLVVNSRVLAYVEAFQGKLREFMQAALQRSVEFIPMIERIFKEEKVPLDLAYLPLVESAFKSTALSRASAKGMWQFMSGTGKEYDLHLDWFIDERSDPAKATRAAAQYLRVLADQFDGDWSLALASYNAGPGRVSGAMKRGKSTDYWKLIESTRYLPRDTREYVPMVMASIIIAKNPAQYGFDLAPVTPAAFEIVTVPDAINLGTVAEWTGVSVDAIRALNPELRRATTPLGKHDLRVPLGTGPTVEAELAKADPTVFASSQFKWHFVAKGETLRTIAAKYKVTTSKLAQANDMKTSSKVRVGQRLMVPTTITAPSTLAAAKPPAKPGTASPVATTPKPGTPRPAPSTTTYRVQAGDTLTAIARQFDMTVVELKTLNRLSSDRITPGDRLTVRR